MARKGSGSAIGGLALVLVVILGAIAKYAKELLVIVGVVFAIWTIYRLVFAKAAGTPPLPQVEPEPILPLSPLRRTWGATSAAPAAAEVTPAATHFVNRGLEAREPASGANASDGDAYWLVRTRSVAVAGRTLGGSIYFGTGLQAVQLGFPEPALVDPQLPVDRSITDCTVRRLNYWPSYSAASPDARAAYLNWLDSGRKDPKADLGYVFLYFYGLERRALYDAAVSAAAKAELPEIQAEVERLLTIYGGNPSFEMYGGSLLDLLKNRVVEPGLYKLQPPLLRASNGFALDHRIALGQCADDGNPLPAEWAHSWLLAERTTRLRTPATRCPNEFKRLFVQRYGEVFGAGLVLPKNKTRLKMERRPASSTFGHGPTDHTLRFDLPDVTVLTAPVRKLQDIAESCYPRLEGYSRFIGKDASRAESFDAMLELPVVLWPDQYQRVVSNLRKVVGEANRPAAIPFEKFKSWFPEWQTMTRTKLSALARAMSEAGLGMEPDARFGGAVPDTGSSLVFFADDPASASPNPSARYTAAALTLQLGAAVATVDGVPSDVEKGLMTRQLEKWLHLSESERRRLHAFMRLLLAAPPKLNGIKTKIAALDKAQRDAIGDFLTLIAQADSAVTAAEVKNLEKSFRLLGLDPQSVYSKLHVAATEPVTVIPAGGERGHSIPKPPRTRPGTGIELDTAKIATLQKDSERISAILGAIFSGEPVTAEPEVTPVEAESAQAPKAGLLGLRTGDSAFVTTLLGRQQWTRAELEELADDRGFMLDGVLERINDASLDKYEKSLLEGEDPIDVNPEVARELLQ